MSSSFRRSVLAMLFGIAACIAASAQTQTSPAPPGGANQHQATATSSSASAAAGTKRKHGSRAKTPPGKQPRGVAECNQGDKAQRQRCVNDMYGPNGPRV